MGKVADLSVFTPGGQPGAPNPSEGLAILRQNQTAFMETLGVMPPESLTIADGAISPTTAVCIVDAEGCAPADDLTTINATLSDGSTLHDGMVILLSAKDASRVVTVKNSDAPNGVKTVDGKDIALSPEWSLVLQYVGGVWQQLNVSAPLKPATKTTIGGVKVGDGLTIRDGVMSADLATAEDAGRVKASTTAQAGAVPTADVNGVLDETWLKIAVDAAREAGNNSLPKASAGYRLIVSSTDTEHSGDYVIKSSELPANIALNSTYDIENPFGDIPCIVVVEIKDSLGGVWSPQAMAQPNSANSTNDYIGVYGGSVGDIIRVTTGRTFLSRRQRMDGWLGQQGGGVITSAPCRVHVWKLMP